MGYKSIANIDAEQICTKGGGMEATSKLVDVFLEVCTATCMHTYYTYTERYTHTQRNPSPR